MKVSVVGAGFTGLTLAHYLQKHGLDVVIYEKNEDPGGLINTQRMMHGMVESAANALLADKNVEDLFVDLGVEFAERGPSIKKRYIYWDGPKRWPINWSTSWLGIKRIFDFMILDNRKLWPKEGESIREWSNRVMNREFTERMLEPALQGVYAGDSRQMSASLIFGSMMSKQKPPRGYYRGSIAPDEGMGALIQALKDSLQEKGALFQYNTHFKMPEFITNPVVICTSAWGAADVLKDSHPQWSSILARCESLPLARVTCFFEPGDNDIDGFGCLFPKKQGFSSLGVLFDSCIFPNRSKQRAESWILGGALNNEITAWSEIQILDNIIKDREKLYGAPSSRLLEHKIVWWTRAIPHYTTEWEKCLKALRPAAPLYLHGNYMGQLGLSKILAKSIHLADEIKENYG